MVGLPLLSLGLVALSALRGNAVSWPSWVLPVLLIGNAWVFFYRGMVRWKTAERIYYVISVAVATAIILWFVAR